MLSSLLGKLFGQSNGSGPQSMRNVKHRVSDIGDLLRQYQAENHLVTAELNIDPGNPRRTLKTSTGIVAVDSKSRAFVIDPLLPLEANKRLGAGTSIHFSLSHGGVRHQFESPWKKSEGEGDQQKHWFDFPKGIEQVQMRDAFRVKMSQAHPIKVALTHPEKPPMAGTIADLSASGLRLRIPGVIKPRPTRGEEYTSCHFVLSDGTPIVCRGRLMHWQYDPDLDVTFMGVQFEELDGNTQRALSRYVTGIQRKQRL